jgi:hypothetical protein
MKRIGKTGLYYSTKDGDRSPKTRQTTYRKSSADRSVMGTALGTWTKSRTTFNPSKGKFNK